MMTEQVEDRDFGLSELEDILNSLSQIEKNIIRRKDLQRSFDQQLLFRREIFASLLALIFALLMIFFEMSHLAYHFHEGHFHSIGLIFIYAASLFVIVYFLAHFLWKSPLFIPVRYFFERKAQKNLDSVIFEINQENRQLCQSEPLTKEIVPKEYLSIQVIVILSRYFQFGQANYLDMAIEMMRKDLKSSGVRLESLTHKTMLVQEKAYLEQYFIDQNEQNDQNNRNQKKG